MELDAALDGRVIDDATRVWLVSVPPQIEVHAEAFAHLGKVVLRRLHSGKSPRPFDPALSRCKPVLREDRRRVAILRRASGMKRLSHRAEHLAQTRGLCGRE